MSQWLFVLLGVVLVWRSAWMASQYPKYRTRWIVLTGVFVVMTVIVAAALIAG